VASSAVTADIEVNTLRVEFENGDYLALAEGLTPPPISSHHFGQHGLDATRASQTSGSWNIADAGCRASQVRRL
jgi:hypothetical protein